MSKWKQTSNLCWHYFEGICTSMSYFFQKTYSIQLSTRLAHHVTSSLLLQPSELLIITSTKRISAVLPWWQLGGWRILFFHIAVTFCEFKILTFVSRMVNTTWIHTKSHSMVKFDFLLNFRLILILRRAFTKNMQLTVNGCLNFSQIAWIYTSSHLLVSTNKKSWIKIWQTYVLLTDMFLRLNTSHTQLRIYLLVKLLRWLLTN